VVVEVH